MHQEVCLCSATRYPRQQWAQLMTQLSDNKHMICNLNVTTFTNSVVKTMCMCNGQIIIYIIYIYIHRYIIVTLCVA